MTDAADRTTWSSRVGAVLTLATPDGRALSATLTDCTLTDELSGSFTLTFLTSDDTAGQDTYLVRDDDMDDTPVFLVPSRQDGAGVTLHAIFNLRRPYDHEKDGEA